jgi:hypothetical protein
MKNGDIREGLHAWGVVLQVNSEDRGAESRLYHVKERLLALRFYC